MRELKVCTFQGTSLSEVSSNFNHALDNLSYDQIFEIVEPFHIEGNWHAGFCYWKEQRRLRAV